MEYICREHGRITEDPVTHAAQYHEGKANYVAIPKTSKESKAIKGLRNR